MVMARVRSKTTSLNAKLVQQCHLFSQLPHDLISDITLHFRRDTWTKNTYISQKQLLERFYILTDGRIEMVRINPQTGRCISLELLGPGDGFDLIALLDGKPHDMVFSPIEALKVISVPMTKMREWIWTYPELNQQLMIYIAQKFRERENMATDFSLYNTRIRLSRIILKNINNHVQQQHTISGLSDDVLARLVGSVRQVINQQLQTWKKEGVIEKKRNQIVVKNLQKIIDDAHLSLVRATESY